MRFLRITMALAWCCLFISCVTATASSSRSSNPNPATSYTSNSVTSDGASPALTPDPSIKRVHLIFSNHFDAGFGISDGPAAFAVEIVNLYFQSYLPQIAVTAKYLSGLHNYTYTTQGWIVYLYLHCDNTSIPSAFGTDIHCPNAGEVKDFRDAISRGIVTWHALPFNAHIEMMNPTMLDLAIKWVHALDDEFGVRRKTVISQRDVPGITAGAIPTLVKNGIRAVNVGVNTMSAAPEVPSVFRWRNPNNASEEVIGMWVPGGYGWYIPELSTILPGWDTILAYYWRDDNQGPGHGWEEDDVFTEMKDFYPNATIFASTFEDFVDELESQRDKLPIVSAEIGDTWNHGFGSDPLKLQRWREISRAIEMDNAHDPWNVQDPAVRKFLSIFLKVSEHTFGLDAKKAISDKTSWDNNLFYQARKTPAFLNIEDSWVEQRKYIDLALQFLPPGRKARILRHLLPQRRHPNRLGTDVQQQFWKQQACGAWDIGFGNAGDITHLTHLPTGQVWFDDTNSIQFAHTTYTYDDILDYILAYGRCSAADCPDWYIGDFGKAGLNGSHTAVHQTFFGTTLGVYQDECNYTMYISMKSNPYGPPRQIRVLIDLNDPLSVSFEVILLNKTTTRMPEALWYSFKPVTRDPNGKWTVDKVGSPILVSNVVKNGTYHVHGVWDSVKYAGSDGQFSIQSLDAGLVAMGERSPFPTPFEPTDPAQGVHFILFNNIWSTNYILWYPFQAVDLETYYRFKFQPLLKNTRLTAAMGK